MADRAAPHMLAVTLKTASLPRLYTDGWYAFMVTLYEPNPAFGRDPMEPERIPVSTLPDREGIALIRGAQPGVLVNQMLVRWRGQDLPLVFDSAAGKQYQVLTSAFPERDPYVRLRPLEHVPAPGRLSPRSRAAIAVLAVSQILVVLALLLHYIM